MLFSKDLAMSGGNNGYLPDVARKLSVSPFPRLTRLNFLIL